MGAWFYIKTGGGFSDVLNLLAPRHNLIGEGGKSLGGKMGDRLPQVFGVGLGDRFER